MIETKDERPEKYSTISTRKVCYETNKEILIEILKDISHYQAAGSAATEGQLNLFALSHEIKGNMLIEILPCVNMIKVINPFSRYQSTTFFSIVITFPVSMHSMHVKRKSPCLVQFIRHCYDNSKIVELWFSKYSIMPYGQRK